MTEYGLPKSVTVREREFPIKYDFRGILAILEVLADKKLKPAEQQKFALQAFYYKADLDEMPLGWRSDAFAQLLWFLAAGRENEAKGPKLMDWAKDYTLIIGPVNRVMGGDIRERENVHWWTFVDAYMEIGDCLFAQVVRIRKKKAERKKLDKWEEDFYRKNRGLIDLRESKKEFTDANMAFFASLKG